MVWWSGYHNWCRREQTSTQPTWYDVDNNVLMHNSLAQRATVLTTVRTSTCHVHVCTGGDRSHSI